MEFIGEEEEEEEWESGLVKLACNRYGLVSSDTFSLLCTHYGYDANGIVLLLCLWVIECTLEYTRTHSAPTYHMASWLYPLAWSLVPHALNLMQIRLGHDFQRDSR